MISWKLFKMKSQAGGNVYYVYESGAQRWFSLIFFLTEEKNILIIFGKKLRNPNSN